MDSSSSSPLSSPLSSVASRSPSLPLDYPSPPPSNVSDTAILSLLRDVADGSRNGDGPPPAKRQKTMKLKELKTEYLDLSILNDSSDEQMHKNEDQKLKRLTEALRSKRKIVVIAGAGISVSAGIPDFRSSTGLFNTLRSQHKLKSSGKHLFDASVYRNDSSTSSFHDMVRELSHLTQNAQPTQFHHMLATLAEEGRLLRLYSQNVDGIDTALEPLVTRVPLNKKGPWPKTIQLHGGLSKMVCSKCGHLEDFNGALFEGPEPPSCPECETTDVVRIASGLRSHGIGRLRPRMVLYNEFNPDEEAIGEVSHADLKSRPDAVIVVGTSLKVPGIRRLAKEMCAVTRGRRGGFTAWINHDPEPSGIEFKDSWDLVVKGECDEVARHVGLPRWDDKDVGDYTLVSKEDEQAKGGIVEVVVESKPLDVVKTQGFLTPGASPRQQSPTPVNGASRPIQSKLPFATQSITNQEMKVKRKYSRKPTAPKPANQITKAFTTTKSTKPFPHKDSKAKGGITSNTSSTIKHSGFQNALFPGLRPVSPTDHRNNSETKNFEIQLPAVEVDKRDQYQPGDDSSPKTPVTPDRPYDRHATISPKSVPTGMENLIS